MSKPYIPNDKWARKAAKEGFRARSVYKLRELQERYRFLRPGMKVLDLGAAPGSWLQEASSLVGPQGIVIGVDVSPIAFVADNVTTIEADVLDELVLFEKLKHLSTSFDVILSDMAPATTGIKDVDQWRSIELAEAAISIAKKVLKPSGSILMKIFRGGDFDAFLGVLKREWKTVKLAHPQASRERSKEIYVWCKGGSAILSHRDPP